MAEEKKLNRVQVIRLEFPDVKLQAMKALTDSDKSQLASAIVRDRKMDPKEVDFALVDY